MKDIDVAGALRDHHGPEETRDHVIVMDDDPTMIGYHSAVIGRALPEHTILEAEHPYEAIAHLERAGVAGRVAFIMTDWNMPYMTGDQFAMLARGERVGKKALDNSVVQLLRSVPILMMTSDNKAVELKQLVDRGILQHVGEKGADGIRGIAMNMKLAIEQAGGLRGEEIPSY